MYRADKGLRIGNEEEEHGNTAMLIKFRAFFSFSDDVSRPFFARRRHGPIVRCHAICRSSGCMHQSYNCGARHALSTRLRVRDCETIQVSTGLPAHPIITLTLAWH